MATCACGCGALVKGKWKQGHNPKTRGARFTDEHKAKLSASNRGKQAGEKHPNWGKHRPAATRSKISDSMRSMGANRKPDDQVTSASLHEWLRANFTWPDECEECGKPRPKTRNHDLANIAGHVYTRNRADYRVMCRSCHLKFDYAAGRPSSRLTPKLAST